MDRCIICNKYAVFDSQTRNKYLQELKKTGYYNEKVLDQMCIECLGREVCRIRKREKAFQELREIVKKEGEKSYEN